MPDKPGMNATGTNTAINTIAIATNAPPTSSIVNCVAVTGSLPSSMCRLTFSITTIASSTTVATAKIIANNVKRLIDIPSGGRATNVPNNETGIVTHGINVERQSPKNTKIIKITMIDVINTVNSTSLIDSRTNFVPSLMTSIFKPVGNVFSISTIFFSIKSMMLISFAPGSLSI